MKYEALEVVAVLVVAYGVFRLMYRAITGGWNKSEPKLEDAEAQHGTSEPNNAEPWS